MEVREGDLSVVEPARTGSAETRSVRFGGLVGDVWVVEVKPGEEGPPIVLLQPLEPEVDDAHYRVTPYTFQPRAGRRLVTSEYVDMGQGLLEVIAEIHDTWSQQTEDEIVVEG